MDINFDGYDEDVFFEISNDNGVCSVHRFSELDVKNEAEFVSALYNTFTGDFGWPRSSVRDIAKMVTFITSGAQKTTNECLEHIMAHGLECYTAPGASNTQRGGGGFHDIHLWVGTRGMLMNYISEYAEAHPSEAENPGRSDVEYAPGSKSTLSSKKR